MWVLVTIAGMAVERRGDRPARPERDAPRRAHRRGRHPAPATSPGDGGPRRITVELPSALAADPAAARLLAALSRELSRSGLRVRLESSAAPAPRVARSRARAAQGPSRRPIRLPGRSGRRVGRAQAPRWARASSAASRVIAASISARWVNACGKLPICSPVRAISSENRPDVVGVGEHLLERGAARRRAGRRGSARRRRRSAQRERALRAAQAVGRGLRVVAVDQAVGDQLLVHRGAASTATCGSRPSMKPTVGIRSSAESRTSVS